MSDQGEFKTVQIVKDGKLLPPEPGALDGVNLEPLADVMWELAEEINAAEIVLRDEAIKRIDTGDHAGARELLVRWQTESPCDIVAGLRKVKK